MTIPNKDERNPAPKDGRHSILKILPYLLAISLTKSVSCLPLWGRWQSEGLTDEVGALQVTPA